MIRVGGLRIIILEDWDERLGTVAGNLLFVDVVQSIPDDEKRTKTPVRIVKPIKLQPTCLNGTTPRHHRLDTRGIKSRHESESCTALCRACEAYEMFGIDKTWYDIMDQDVNPIVSSLMYILHRFDYMKPYYFSHSPSGKEGGDITILSLAAVDMILGK